jgi:hypothetical protein
VRVFAAALCVLALTACNDSGGGGEATVTRGELPRTVLQPADVGSDWAQFDEGRQIRLDAHPGPRSDPARFGREVGWKARYRRLSAELGEPAIVESRSDLFEAPGGAGEDLDAYREELEAGVPGSGGTATLLEAPKLGEEAVAAELRIGPQVSVTVAWRRANATASVLVQGRASGTTLDDAVALARAQDRRLARAARG